jgi:hypothetical protein
MNIIAMLSFIQHVRMVPHRTETPFLILLIQDSSSGILRCVHLQEEGFAVVWSM